MESIRRPSRSGVFAAALLSVLILSGCGKGRRAGYVSEQGYGLDPPSGWKVSTEGRPMVDMMAVAPRDSDFAANMNVTVVNANGTPDVAYQQMQAMMPRMFPGYQMSAHRNVTVDGEPALDVTSVYNLPLNNQRMWLRQMVAFHGGKTYTFSCTALDSNRSRYEPAFNTSLASVHWR